MLTESRSRPMRAYQVLLSLLLCGGVSGCGVAYMAQAAQGQWSLMRARRPIARVLADPHATPALKTRLELVLDARDFASSALQLPDNRSYRSYSDLRRPYAVWNVVAAHDTTNTFFTMQPVPYKTMLILGASNGDWGGVGYISAFDAETGAVIGLAESRFDDERAIGFATPVDVDTTGHCIVKLLPSQK